ncbi:SWI5-dependent HO expression protein 4 [Coemansia sp. RSA 1822]|nr:SWI5-dependent HO expression protein 4 [Coemansia sp. RSA 638]KAJ2565394.1 SWI5-dependent HO expression protein 4 [Coemansia sp. RSA 1822]
MSHTIDESKIEHIADGESVITVVAEECPGVEHDDVEVNSNGMLKKFTTWFNEKFPSKFSLLDTTQASTMGSDQLQGQVDQLTAQLQTDSSNAPRVLLERARVYGDLGETSLAREDIARAASLVREPAYRSESSVAAVERAVRELSVSGDNKSQTEQIVASDQDIIDLVVQNTSDVASVVALEQRIRANKTQLSGEQVCALLDAFHDMCTDGKLEIVEAVASCVSAALARLSVSEDAKSVVGAAETLTVAVHRIVGAWAKHSDNGEFKQQACKFGAKMYTTAVYALSTHVDCDAEVLQSAVDFYVGQIWLVGTLPASDGDDVCQGILRLLTASRPQLIYSFVKSNGSLPVERLLNLLGQPRSSNSRSLAMLIASQLTAAVQDPEASSMFPGYVASTSRTNAPAALVQLRTEAAEILDTLVQSTIQSERTRGLYALAALYESGAGSEMAVNVWTKNGWAEELWDQGEFDLCETQLSLVHLADACSTDTKVSASMKKLGNGLVQALARKHTGELGEIASVVLAKWSNLPAPVNPGTNTEPNDGPETLDTNDADPVQLADSHIARIIALADSNASDPKVATAAERSTEALGFLCLNPALKQHIVQSPLVLQTIFTLAQKSNPQLKFAAVMLIRNLTQYKPVLSEEQKRVRQMQKLSQRAQTGQTIGSEIKEMESKDQEFDDASAVAARAKAVCQAGAVACLVSAVQGKVSDSTKDAVAEVFVALATSHELRGQLVQQGAVHALLSILSSDAPRAPSKDAKYTPTALRHARDKHVAWALAKCAISVPPHLAFRDPRALTRLILSLLAEESDAQSLLIRFETLLALTNLASAEPGSSSDVRGFLACDLNGMSLIEMCVLNDHVMVRRAATELVCNLVHEPRVFERFVEGADKSVGDEESRIVELPDDIEDAEDVGSRRGYRAQRMHVLVALSDVDDAATRSAASGALAVLSNDPRCCRYLTLVHPRALDVLLGLADTKDTHAAALRHRVAVICANAAACGDPRVMAKLRNSSDVARVLQSMVEDPQAPCFAAAQSACEALK